MPVITNIAGITDIADPVGEGEGVFPVFSFPGLRWIGVSVSPTIFRLEVDVSGRITGVGPVGEKPLVDSSNRIIGTTKGLPLIFP